MSATLTVEEPNLGWGETTDEPEPEALHLVLAWSREEPHRLGEAAAITGPRVLGRGDALPDDPAPRAAFARQRPTGATPTPPLAGPRISRRQLSLAPTDDGGLSVRSLGRCPLLVNGVERASGVVHPGDTLTLQNALVLLVVRRSPSLWRLRTRPVEPFAFGGPDATGVVGESAAAWALRDAIAFAARSDGHLLVRGERCVGKDLAARAVHSWSPRGPRAFVGHKPPSPRASSTAELFGTADGYPTAGARERPGLLAQADGGTLFLDELGELPMHMQAQLLSVLERGGEYRRLGELLPRRSDVAGYDAAGCTNSGDVHGSSQPLSLESESHAYRR